LININLSQNWHSYYLGSFFLFFVESKTIFENPTKQIKNLVSRKVKVNFSSEEEMQRIHFYCVCFVVRPTSCLHWSTPKHALFTHIDLRTLCNFCGLAEKVESSIIQIFRVCWFYAPLIIARRWLLGRSDWLLRCRICNYVFAREWHWIEKVSRASLRLQSRMPRNERRLCVYTQICATSVPLSSAARFLLIHLARLLSLGVCTYICSILCMPIYFCMQAALLLLTITLALVEQKPFQTHSLTRICR